MENETQRPVGQSNCASPGASFQSWGRGVVGREGSVTHSKVSPGWSGRQEAGTPPPLTTRSTLRLSRPPPLPLYYLPPLLPGRTLEDEPI